MQQYFMKYNTLYCKEPDTTELCEEQNREVTKYGMVAPVECWTAKSTRGSCISKCAAFEMLDDQSSACYLACCSRRIDLSTLDSML